MLTTTYNHSVLFTRRTVLFVYENVKDTGRYLHKCFVTLYSTYDVRSNYISAYDNRNGVVAVKI